MEPASTVAPPALTGAAPAATVVAPAVAAAPAKAAPPAPPSLDVRLQAKGLRRGDPVFIRIFKQEKELELWMRSGRRFTRLRTYPICRTSGEAGPKRAYGDYQNPEGFYSVGRSQMKRDSAYHRAFDIGYPNEFDRALGRSGNLIMVHGACRSVGCFAMTDPLIEEIYDLVDAALAGGQERFDVHIFPFRLDAVNMDSRQPHHWGEFWWNLKQGYDLFEQSLLPPAVSVAEGKHVFTPAPVPEPIRREEVVATACVASPSSRAGKAKSKRNERTATKILQGSERPQPAGASPFDPLEWRKF